uniref:Uncharacterized protein n=1 Tax=Cucumis melo TaxID=3656 RepID=A0A9I9D3F6_CUCME
MVAQTTAQRDEDHIVISRLVRHPRRTSVASPRRPLPGSSDPTEKVFATTVGFSAPNVDAFIPYRESNYTKNVYVLSIDDSTPSVTIDTTAPGILDSTLMDNSAPLVHLLMQRALLLQQNGYVL